MAIMKSSILTRDLQPPGIYMLNSTSSSELGGKPSIVNPTDAVTKTTLCHFLPGHVSTRQTLLIPARGLVLGSTEEREPVWEWHVFFIVIL